MNFSWGKVIFWGILFIFFLFLSCRTLTLLFSYSGSWGGGFFLFLVGWGFSSSGWTFLPGIFRSFNPEGKSWAWCSADKNSPLPACPFRNVSMEKIFWFAVNFPSLSISSGSPRMEGHQWCPAGCRDRNQQGAAAGAGSTHGAASFPSPNPCSAHFLSHSSAPLPWLPAGSWSSMIKVTTPPFLGFKWDFSDKTQQCWRSHTRPCLESFDSSMISTLPALAELYCGHHFHGFWKLKSNLERDWQGPFLVDSSV